MNSGGIDTLVDVGNNDGNNVQLIRNEYCQGVIVNPPSIFVCVWVGVDVGIGGHQSL